MTECLFSPKNKKNDIMLRKSIYVYMVYIEAKKVICRYMYFSIITETFI